MMFFIEGEVGQMVVFVGGDVVVWYVKKIDVVVFVIVELLYQQCDGFFVVIVY